MTQIDMYEDSRVKDWIAFVGDYGGEQYYRCYYSQCSANQAVVDLEEDLEDEGSQYITAPPDDGVQPLSWEVYYYLYPVDSAEKVLKEIEANGEKEALSNWNEGDWARECIGYRYVVSLQGERIEG